MMKRVIFIFLMVCLLPLVSCRFYKDTLKSSDSKNSYLYDIEVSKKYVNSLIDAINRKSYKDLEKLMSGSDEVSFSSEDINQIFNLFTSKIKNPNYQGHSYTLKSLNFGKYVGTVDDRLIVETEDNHFYKIIYSLTYIDDYYEKNEGFVSLQILDEFSSASFIYTGEWPSLDEGVHIQVLKGEMLDGFTEIRKFMNDLFFYRYVERSKDVTMLEVEKFLGKNKSYNDFVEYFGKPNMIYSDYYHVWETADNKFIRIYPGEAGNISKADVCDKNKFIYEIR